MSEVCLGFLHLWGLGWALPRWDSMVSHASDPMKIKMLQEGKSPYRWSKRWLSEQFQSRSRALWDPVLKQGAFSQSHSGIVKGRDRNLVVNNAWSKWSAPHVWLFLLLLKEQNLRGSAPGPLLFVSPFFLAHLTSAAHLLWAMSPTAPGRQQNGEARQRAQRQVWPQVKERGKEGGWTQLRPPSNLRAFDRVVGVILEPSCN